VGDEGLAVKGRIAWVVRSSSTSPRKEQRRDLRFQSSPVLNDLSHDADGDLLGRHRVDRQADGHDDPSDVAVGEAGIPEGLKQRAFLRLLPRSPT